MPTHLPVEDTAPAQLEIRRGKAIWLMSIDACTFVRRLCVLPGAFSLLEGVAAGNVLVRLYPSVVGLSFIEKAWDDLIFGSASLRSPRATAEIEAIESDLFVVDDASGLIHLFVALGVLREVWLRDEKKEIFCAVISIPETPGGEVSRCRRFRACIAARVFGGSDRLEGCVHRSKWLVGLCIRRGRVPSQIADEVGVRKLPTTGEAEPKEIRDACG